ncbi:MAG TPA: ABA4-like family protein [Lacibacter sp.]|nr:ABA4-like family protein [Lacibacter sp.]
MSPDSIFQLCSTIALVAWLILLIASPFLPSVDKFLIGVVIILFAIVYAWLIFQSFTFGDIEKFNTLDGVMQFFTNKTAVAAGWVHYLAFDLMTGIWIKKNAQKHGISHWVLIPCLFFTFMLGPVGLLLYLIIRLFYTKQYFADNY